MKILFVNLTGGVLDQIIAGLARELHETYHAEVVLFLLRRHGKLSNERMMKYYFFQKMIPKWNISSWFSDHISVFNASLSLLKVCRKEYPDLIHTFFAYPAGCASILCKSILKRPLVVTAGGGDVEVVPKIGYGLRLDPLKNRLICYTLGVANHVIVPSWYAKECVLRAGADPNRVSVVPYGIDCKKFNNSELESAYNEAARTHFKVQPSEKVICSLCRLVPKKGLSYLIRAMPEVLEVIPNARLLIGGSGYEEQHLRNLAGSLGLHNKVYFLGHLSENEKVQFLRLCDVYVLPSLSDTFAVSVLEAMACGKPVVITDQVGISGFMEEECGFVVWARDIGMLAKSIITILSNDELRLKYGRNARKRANDLSYRNMATKTKEIYDHVILGKTLKA